MKTRPRSSSATIAPPNGCRLFRLQHTNPVSLAVGYIQQTSAIDEQSVRPRQPALSWIPVRTVTTLAGSKHGGDDAALRIDAANHMCFRVCDIERIMRGVERQPFRSAKFRQFCRAAVTAPSLLPCSGDV